MKICLILEGGGNRGNYTSGVLDAFLDNDIFIPNIYAVSAGALNALSYLSKQKGRSIRISKEYYFSKNCLDYKRILKFKDVLNLDYLLNEVNNQLDPFDKKEFDKNKNNFVVTCTDVVTGLPVYKRIDDYTKDLKYIKASASLPLATSIVEVDSYKLLDGGISDSIPLIKAIEDNYDKIILVLTRDKEYISKPYSLIKAYKAKYFKYPKLIKSMENRYNKYNVTRDLIAKLEKDKKVFAIYPSKPLEIANLEKDINKLDLVYKLGYDDASKLIDKIKEYMEGENK